MTRIMFENGAIEYLRLTNFQTFSDITFDFHPRLNFVIAPNGTGKSSLSHAICLLFNGSPKHIGKPNDTRFIKYGCKEAAIEAKIHFETPVIIRKVLYESNSSQYFVDGKPVSKCIAKKFLLLNPGNMCEFLSQERVSEFAKLSGSDILGYSINSFEDLTTARNGVIALETTQGGIETRISKLEEECSLIQGKYDILKREADKFNEKSDIEDQISMIRKKIIWIEYDDTNKKYCHIKSEIDTIRQNSDNISRAILEVDLEIGRMKSQLVCTKEIDNISRKNMELVVVFNIIEGLNSKQDTVLSTLSILRKRLVNKEDSLSLVKRNILEQNDKLKQEPDVPLALIDRLDEFNRMLEEQKGLKYRLDIESEQRRSLIHETEKKLQYFSEQRNRKLEGLRRINPDTYSGVLWLRNNQSLFSEEVIEPLFLNLEISNRDYESEVGGFMSFFIQSAFITKNPNDFAVLTKHCKEKLNLRLNIFEINGKYCPPNIKLLPPFKAFVTDCLSVRQEYIHFLSATSKLDEIPITKEIVDEAAFRQNYPRMVIAGRYIEFKQSRYTKDYTTLESILKPKSNLQATVSTEEYTQSIRKLKCERDASESKYKDILYTMARLQSEKDELELDVDNRKRAIKQQEFIRLKIQNLTSDVVEIEQEINTIEGSIVDLNKEIAMLGASMANEFDKLEPFLCNSTFFSEVNAIRESEVTNRKLKIEIQHLDAKNADLNKELARTGDTLRKHTNDLADARKDLILSKSRAKKCMFTPEEAELMNNWPSTVDELEREILKLNVSLQFLPQDQNILNEFSNKSQELSRLKKKLDETIKEKHATCASLVDRRDQLKDKLTGMFDTINTRFLHLFSMLKCCGAIEFVYSDGGNYLLCKDWRIDIRVKFRDNTNLEILRGQRQSGGEKSVTTCVYLLALQSLSSSPIKLCDEINQGMDRTNEKIIHRLISECCEKDKTQFFLFSPKLVCDLYYNAFTKVIFIFKGSIEADTTVAGVEKLTYYNH